MTAAPPLNIPEASSTVDVSIIDTTSSIRGIPTWKFVSPSIKGHDYLAAPAFSFLIEYHSNGQSRRLLFDLGIRKDHWNFSPFLLQHLKNGGYEVKVEKSVREILESHNVPCSETSPIEAIFWSHWHWDHTGNPAEFPPATKLIVGPGFKDKLLPGYPANQQSTFLESDYANRDLVELDFSSPSTIHIGQFPTLDYFGDGSFYLLDTPGHAIGHICALARVTTSPDSFIFMGGEYRPSPYLPLPKEITPFPFAPVSLRLTPCPGAMFESLLPHGPDKPFYTPAKLEVKQIHYDVELATKTIEKMQEYDGQPEENVLVVVAHDESLLDVLDFFPKRANGFVEKGWVKEGRWRFLKDFKKAVGYDGVDEETREWGLEGSE